jgi:tryptophan-rich sensory protein
MSDPLIPSAPAGNDRPVEATVLAFIAIIGATALVAALGGLVSASEADPWYASLSKAPGNPPAFVFGIVWPTLYTLMAIGACMVWQSAGSWKKADMALGLFFAQLAPNLAWSFLFFRYHLALAALIDIMVLLVLAAMMTAEFHRHSRIAGWLQYPYIAWLSFAMYLNAWVVFAN